MLAILFVIAAAMSTKRSCVQAHANQILYRNSTLSNHDDEMNRKISIESTAFTDRYHFFCLLWIIPGQNIGTTTLIQNSIAPCPLRAPLVVILVGLPCRGKSLAAHKIARHLCWKGEYAKGRFHVSLSFSLITHPWKPFATFHCKCTNLDQIQSWDTFIIQIVCGEFDHPKLSESVESSFNSRTHRYTRSRNIILLSAAFIALCACDLKANFDIPASFRRWPHEFLLITFYDSTKKERKKLIEQRALCHATHFRLKVFFPISSSYVRRLEIICNRFRIKLHWFPAFPDQTQLTHTCHFISSIHHHLCVTCSVIFPSFRSAKS